MKKTLLIFSAAVVLSVLSGCKYAHGDGPDVATPRSRSKKNSETQKNPRKSNWLTENIHRERVSRKDINTPGANREFKVFPLRDRNRSEDLRQPSSPFFWKN
ncbi:MAG: hypothetical protein IKB25_01885 [Lentisphaeria bacterium]|nr:hypothetical protein [Lentisphaeria bacterium]